MSQTKFTLWLSFLAVCVAYACGHNDEGKNWVVLVAGSNGYSNYRHQSDVCHAYQVAKDRGIPDENIIVMTYDDIANHTRNPKKGQIFNKPGGPNVYKNIPKDYVGRDVTAENFLKVLSGDSDGMKKVGSGKVVESTDKDNIFVFYSDHGGPGMIAFIRDVLYASDLHDTLESMESNNQYSRIALFIEACYAGSMFEKLLPNDTKVYAMTAANSHESSYACYYDSSFRTYLGDEFSTTLLEILDEDEGSSISELYEDVKANVEESHVEEYGDLSFTELTIDSFIGEKKRTSPSRKVSKKSKQHRIHHPHHGAVRTFDVPIVELREKIKAAGSVNEKREYEHQIQNILSKRKVVHSLVHNVLMDMAENDEEKYLELEQMKYSITRQNMYCAKNITKTFHENCFNIPKNPYVAEVIGDLIKLCDVEWAVEDQIIGVIQNVCEEYEKPVHVI